MKRNSLVATVLAFVMALAVTIPSSAQESATSKPERHPEIRKALAALQIAAISLEDASHDFCGYREAALDATNNAVSQLGMAIECDPHAKAAAFSRAGFDSEWMGASSKSGEHHPEIRKALAALHLAANALEDASHDFCGHREDALTAVDNAITELGLAISCDSHS